MPVSSQSGGSGTAESVLSKDCAQAKSRKSRISRQINHNELPDAHKLLEQAGSEQSPPSHSQVFPSFEGAGRVARPIVQRLAGRDAAETFVCINLRATCFAF